MFIFMKSSPRRTARFGWNQLFGVLACLALGLSLAAGCKRSDDPAAATQAGATAAASTKAAQADEGSSSKTGPAGKSAEEIPHTEPAATASVKTAKDVLEAMIAAYRKADSYFDKGSLRVRAVQGGQKDEKAFDYSLVFMRPNKIRLQVFGGVVVCDGREWMAFARNLPDQVVKRPAPRVVDIKTIFSDQVLGKAIWQGPTELFSWVPIPLLLMAADDPRKTILAGSPKAILLEPAKVEDRPCYRVQLARRDGTAVLWIDQASFVLRRMEFPVEAFLRGQTEPKLDDISVVAEFAGAKLAGPVDDAVFRHEIPAKAQVEDRLLPPDLVKAVAMLGKPAPQFAFVGADGKPVDSKSIAGKVTVFDFWATWCQPCRVTLPTMENLYREHKNNPKVRFFAVSIDDPKTGDKEVKAVLDELGVTIPYARDPEQHAGKRFGIPGVPCTCVIGPNNVTEVYETGYRPGLERDLAKRIDRLLAGQDVYPEQLAQFETENKTYAAWLDKWVEKGVYVGPGEDEIQVPEAKISPRTEPKAFVLEPLWKCAEAKMPGNVLVVPMPSGPPKLFVIDSFSSVLEIGAGGKVAAIHPLDLPERQAATMIRTGAGTDGKRLYAVSGMLQQQVYLFDENWKKVLTFPEDALKHPHAGIWDVQLGDLNGDGKLELLIGYNQDVGVQCVSLEGKRIWSNQTLAMVSRVAFWAPDPKGPRYCLCTNHLGSLVPIDALGRVLTDALGRRQEIRVPNRAIHWFLAADLMGDQKPLLAGVYPPEPGVNVVIGIDPSREAELWSYSVPKGAMQRPVELIVAGHLAAKGPGQWLIPGPDGSIAVIAADGNLIDRWQTGSLVAGLATMNVDGQPVLVMASENAVEAWRVKWPAGK